MKILVKCLKSGVKMIVRIQRFQFPSPFSLTLHYGSISTKNSFLHRVDILVSQGEHPARWCKEIIKDRLALGLLRPDWNDRKAYAEASVPCYQGNTRTHWCGTHNGYQKLTFVSHAFAVSGKVWQGHNQWLGTPPGATKLISLFTQILYIEVHEITYNLSA